jgi:SOS-response transcriptional repressor LexA
MAKHKKERATANKIGLKINEVMLEKDMVGDYAAVAALFQVAVPSVYGWVDTGRISKDRLPALAQWSGRPLSWWLDSNQIDLNSAPWQGANVVPGRDLRGLVPLLSKVQAGNWDSACENFDPRDAERWMMCNAKHSERTYALRVTGDSMTAPAGNSRTYPNGCFVFVDPELRNPSNGDRIIAKLASDGEDRVTFKIYKNEDGRQWLQPLNPSHEPIREEFSVLGKVIGKWEDE